MSLTLHVSKRTGDAHKELETIVEENIQKANMWVGQVANPKKHKSASIRFYNKYFELCEDLFSGDDVFSWQNGPGGSFCLTFDHEIGRIIAFCLDEMKLNPKSKRDLSFISHAAAHEVAEIYLSQNARHLFYSHADTSLWDDLKVNGSAALELSKRIHEELNVELLCLKAGYFNDIITYLESEAEWSLKPSKKDILNYNFIEFHETGSKGEVCNNSYVLLNAYLPIYFETIKRHAKKINKEDPLLVRLAQAETAYYESAKNKLPVSLIKSAAELFAKHNGHENEEWSDTFVVEFSKAVKQNLPKYSVRK